jgi:CRP/FNR family transcriptional regulator, dissimilatory nitrate respiration regulator
VIDWPEHIERVPVLAAFPPSLCEAVRLRVLSSGAILFASGTRPRSMHVVTGGEVCLVRRSVSGADIVLQRARRGFLAEASLDQSQYHCDAVAATDATVLVFAIQAFLHALDDPSFRHVWMAHLSGELRRMRAQAERLSLKTAEARIVHYIESEGEDGSLILSRPKKEWAAEIGLTHEALYRALARMVERGKLVIDGARICMRG